MTERILQETDPDDMWATVELMGHAQTAGRISRPADFGGLLRVDVPIEDGQFRSEFYGMSAIYAIRIVSEEIARAYVRPVRGVISYDAPIVTREQHESAIRQMEQESYTLRQRVSELERRLTAVKALPEPGEDYDSVNRVPF